MSLTWPQPSGQRSPRASKTESSPICRHTLTCAGRTPASAATACDISRIIAASFSISGPLRMTFSAWSIR